MKLKTIVVGFDGSPTALEALDAAANLIAEDGTVHVVTAYRVPSPGETTRVLAHLPEEFRTGFDPIAGPQGDLDHAVAHLRERGVTTDAHLVDEHPASAIMDIADRVDADLIVVGSRGLSRPTRFVRGSVSSRIAAHATRSFMVIHD